MNPTCLLCQRIESLQKKESNFQKFLIKEFDVSYFVVGEHQFYPGYSVLYLKEHAREMTDLPEKVQVQFFQELMVASKALQKTFQPFKMNYASLGNKIEHIHWHFFPRYQDDPEYKEHPWIQSSLFSNFLTHPHLALELAEKIRKHI